MGKFIDEVLGLEILFFLARAFINNLAAIHHDETVAITNCIFHVVCDHQRGDFGFRDDFFRQLHDFLGRRGIQRGGMFVEQKDIGP